ncbi:MAG TPA: DUF3857 domain-containing protein [Bacteroidales bacterium]|nr:DUF3857 domain-containing protein [Bacteroidales bacterium]
MMRIFSVLILLLLATSAVLQAQDSWNRTTWEEKPVYFSLESENQNENAVGIFYNEKTEYLYNPEGQLEMIHTLHRRIRLNTDDAINGFNKLSVSMADVIEMEETKARVIKPDGRIVEFNSQNIREIVDAESGDNYRIFAIDGIEKGDDLEYIIIRRMEGANFGRAYFQFEFPVMEVSFELISPRNLKYAAKGYNGFPQPVADTTADGRNRLSCTARSISGLRSESYFYQNPHRARVEYKLEYNLARGKGSLLRWSDAAQRMYEMIYSDADPKIVKKWIRTIDPGNGTGMEKASAVEDYIKRNIHIDDGDNPEYHDLEYVRTRKVTNEMGVVRLYANILRALDIRHELVLTSERDNIRFDPDFHSWNYLRKYLIYLSDEKIYIDPANDLYRVGCIPGELTATYGLFISVVKIGDFESALGKIRFIEPAAYSENYDNMYIEISSDPVTNVSTISATRGLKGLSGGYIYQIYKSIDEEKKQELLRSVMESKATNPDYKTLTTLERSDIEFMRDAEFIIFSDFTTSSLLEMAGDKLLLNFGEIIGPQVELYDQENKERSAESPFNRWYLRRIVFKVPDGYRIVNPEAAEMNITGIAGGETAFGFVSEWTCSGNIYTVDIDEYYKKVFVEPAEFSGFRDVINAAANFNKVVLVLEKN